MEYELKVGDSIISENRYSGLSIEKVERTTPTLIVLSSGSKIRKPFKDWNYSIGDSGWNKTSYKPVTEDLMTKYNRQEHLRFIEKFKYSSLSNDKLYTIVNILKDEN